MKKLARVQISVVYELVPATDKEQRAISVLAEMLEAAKVRRLQSGTPLSESEAA